MDKPTVHCHLCDGPGDDSAASPSNSVSGRAFRLEETYANGATFNGYSFGKRVWHQMPHECTFQHVCGPTPARHFAFAVKKTPEDMVVTFYSPELFEHVESVVSNEVLFWDEDMGVSCNGLALLKWLPHMNVHLMDVQLENASVKYLGASDDLVAELEIFVKGFLADTESFASFGLTRLYEEGWMDELHWQSLQHDKFEADLDALENTYGQSFSGDNLRLAPWGALQGIYPPIAVGSQSDFMTSVVSHDVSSVMLEATKSEQSISHMVEADRVPPIESVTSLMKGDDMGTRQIQESGPQESAPYDKVEIGRRKRSKRQKGVALSPKIETKSPILRVQDRIETLPCSRMPAKEQRQHLSIEDLILRGTLSHDSPGQDAYAIPGWSPDAHTANFDVSAEGATSFESAQRDSSSLRTFFKNHNSPEYELWSAVRKGDLAQVIKILDHASNCAILREMSGFSVLDRTIINTNTWMLDQTGLEQALPRYPSLNDPFPDQIFKFTILTAAVKIGNRRIVQKLLEFGFDVNVATPYGTALSMAAVLDRLDIMQLLVDEGADMPNAILFVKQTFSSMGLPAAEMETQVSKVSTRLTNFFESPHPRNRIRRLHQEFCVQHSLISDLSHSSPWNTVFSSDVISSRRAAWSTGFEVMRRLGRGEHSYTTSEIILFPAVVRSICTIMDAERSISTPSHLDFFKADLSRWQLLLRNDISNLCTFRLCAESLWEISPQLWTDVPPDTSTFAGFQKLVKALVTDATYFLNIRSRRAMSPSGLLACQERWMRSHKDYHVRFQFRAESGETEYRTTWQGREGNAIQGSYREADQSSTPPVADKPQEEKSGTVIAFVMAGAIFGIFLAFLIDFNGWRSRMSITSHLNLSNIRHCFRPTIITRLVYTQMEHITNVLESSRLLSQGTVESLRADTSNLITTGVIDDFPSLAERIKQQLTKAASHELHAHECLHYVNGFTDNWSGSYRIQENYFLLQVYLGSKNLVNIVPQKFAREDMLAVDFDFPFGVCITDDAPASFMSSLSSQSQYSVDTQNILRTDHELDAARGSPSSSASQSSPQKKLQSLSVSSEPPSTDSPITPLSSVGSQSCEHRCQECGKHFSNLGNLNKHRNDKRSKALGGKYRCRKCGKGHSRKHYSQKHERNCQGDLAQRLQGV